MVHLGRQPKPKDLIGRLLYGLGGMMRGLGGALDTVGVAVQGPYAAVDQRELLLGVACVCSSCDGVVVLASSTATLAV